MEHWKGDGRAVEDFPGTNEEMLCVEIGGLIDSAMVVVYEEYLWM